MFLKISVYLLITLIVSGCSVHRLRKEEPVIRLPDTFSGGGAGEGLPSPAVGWWEAFGDSRLNALMEDAFLQNLDIARAYERLRQAQAIMRSTASSLSPRVSLEGQAGRVRQQGMFGAATTGSYRLSAAAGYEIDLWHKLKAQTEAARLDAEASEEDIKTLFISISARIADLYYLAVEQRAQIELSDRSIASFQDTLELVERRYREGLAPAMDVYQSRRNLAAVRAARPVFESNLSAALNALSVLTGRFPDRELAGNSAELPEPPAFPSGIPSQVLTRRPDVRSALLRLRASDWRAGAAVAGRFPSFNIIGSYGGASERVKTLLDSPNIFWNLLLDIAHPLLDGGRLKAEAERAEAVFREQLFGYHQTVLTSFKEVEDALAGINAAETRLSVLDAGLIAASGALRLSLDRYAQGLTDYLPVLTAQQRYYESESSIIAARQQRISVAIQLARVLGAEWTDGIIEQTLTSGRREGDTHEQERKIN
ncbi:MAG: efflux transporter outer membrane subunit [Nitrospirota bacterium]|nr:efflux transporter outer membrane subunit [Nitrospirota bacterium]